MRAHVIVSAKRLCRQVLSALNRLKQMQIEPFISCGSIESLNVGVLRWLAKLLVQQGMCRLREVSAFKWCFSLGDYTYFKYLNDVQKNRSFYFRKRRFF